MKLKLLLAGVLITLVTTGVSSKASAQDLPFPLGQDSSNTLFVDNTILSPLKLEVKQETKPEPKKEEVKPPEAPKPIEYVVVDGDSLEKIATAHNVKWMAIWSKNTNIAHPDVILVGDKLIIPFPDEIVPERALPTPPPTVIESTATVTERTAQVSQPATQTAVRGSSSGNLYSPGYCTWYVKNRRPDLPNNLGNADTWYSRATAQGMATGTTPAAGAAAQVKGRMHVVYVERVNGDGTIVISEMNYAGLYSQRTTTVNASDYYYIY